MTASVCSYSNKSTLQYFEVNQSFWLDLQLFTVNLICSFLFRLCSFVLGKCAFHHVQLIPSLNATTITLSLAGNPRNGDFLVHSPRWILAALLQEDIVDINLMLASFFMSATYFSGSPSLSSSLTLYIGIPVLIIL